LKKIHTIFHFCDAIVYYFKSLITIALLLHCVSTNGWTNWRGGFEFRRFRFAIEVETTNRVITFAKATRVETSWSSLKTPCQRRSLSFYSSPTCHSLNYSFVCLNIVNNFGIENTAMILTSFEINIFFKVATTMLTIVLAWVHYVFFHHLQLVL
jgi:hypothetical protein